MTTDTPRTDAEVWKVVYHHKDEIVVDADFARELERELAEYITENIRLWKIADAQMELEAEVDFWKEKAREAEESESKHEAEVERLRNELSDWDYGTRAKREQERAEKADAEVERLKEILRTYKIPS